MDAFPPWAEERYRCIRRISRTTSTTVWLVRRLGVSASKLHVLKEIRDPSDESDRLPQEVALLTSQQHPFILSVVEVLAADAPSAHLGLVTEFCDQGDLHCLLTELRRRGERVPEVQVLTWLAQLCLALSHLHRQRILHRDVKASNIFVTADRKLKLGDFGLARAFESLEAVRSRVGSPFYISPEICLNQPYGTESDVWSLGCVLYEMVTLRHAFYAESMPLVLERILAAAYDPPPPAACSDGVRELIGEILQLDPKARLSAQQVLQHPALRPVIEQLEPAAPPPPALRQRLAEGSAEVEAMRAAVRAAEASLPRAAEPAAAGEGGSSLLERGLKLLGIALQPGVHPPSAAAPSAAAPSAAALGSGVTGRQAADEAVAEARGLLAGLREQLEVELGAGTLERARRLASESWPGGDASAASLSSWEEGTLAALRTELAPHLGSAAAADGWSEGDDVARRVLSLAMWEDLLAQPNLDAARSEAAAGVAEGGGGGGGGITGGITDAIARTVRSPWIEQLLGQWAAAS